MRVRLGWIVVGLIGLVIASAMLARALALGPQPPGTMIVENAVMLDQPTQTNLTILTDEMIIAERVEGDLIAIARSVMVTETGHVTGNLWVVSDSFLSEGRIDGNLVVISDGFTHDGVLNGGLTLLADNALIEGRIAGAVNVSATNVSVEPAGLAVQPLQLCASTVVGVSEFTCSRAGRFALLESLVALRTGGNTGIDLSAPLLSGDLLGAAAILALTLGIVGVSALAVAAFPRQISRIEDAIRAQPRSMGGAGLALYALALGVSLGMIVLLGLLPAVGVVLMPIWLLLGIGLLALLLMGWITLSMMIGEWLMRRLSRTGAPPLVTAVAGGLILWAIFAAAAILPFGAPIGGIILALIGAVGAGAALFTRLGTRPLRSSYFVQG
jgi:hypothetical protein